MQNKRHLVVPMAGVTGALSYGTMYAISAGNKRPKEGGKMGRVSYPGTSTVPYGHHKSILGRRWLLVGDK